jgi:hypothetical protein
MPDFNNLRRALLCQGEPDRVPLFEGTVHEDIKSRFLGKDVGGLEAEVEFHMAAGYDYVPLTIGLRQTMRGETSGIMGDRKVETSVLKPALAQYNPFQASNSVPEYVPYENYVAMIEAVKKYGRYPISV